MWDDTRLMSSDCKEKEGEDRILYLLVLCVYLCVCKSETASDIKTHDTSDYMCTQVSGRRLVFETTTTTGSDADGNNDLRAQESE